MKKRIKRVYVAGLLTPRGTNSAHPAIDYLRNIHNLTRWSIDAFKAGFDPFCPALDYLYFLLLRDGEHITEAMIKRYSKSWLEASDAIFLTPGWKKSPGSVAELALAEKLDMPVFKTIDEMIEYNKSNGYDQT